MARKRGAVDVNKAQVIRDALAENRGKPPRVIAQLLKDKGLDVTPQYVSIVKSQSKGKRGKIVRVRKVRRGAKQLGALSAAIEFIRAAGGLEGAKAALSAVETIKNLS